MYLMTVWDQYQSVERNQTKTISNESCSVAIIFSQSRGIPRSAMSHPLPSGTTTGHTPNRKKTRTQVDEDSTCNAASPSKNGSDVQLPSNVADMKTPNEQLYCQLTCMNPTCKCKSSRDPNKKGKKGGQGYYDTIKTFPITVLDLTQSEDALAEMLKNDIEPYMNQDSKTPIAAFKAWAPMGKFKGVEYKKQGKGPDASYYFKCVYLCRYQSNGHYTCKMQVLHKLGSDTVELQWFREGTGHMQSHDRFLTHAEHKAFQHVRVKKGTNLPFAVEECIQAYLAANPTKSATDARNHLKNEHGSTFDFTPEQWSAIWSKIVTHGRHVLTKITAEYAPMSMTNQLRDIQEFAEANTWERRVEELGSDFTEHTRSNRSYRHRETSWDSIQPKCGYAPDPRCIS